MYEGVSDSILPMFESWVLSVLLAVTKDVPKIMRFNKLTLRRD